MNRIIKKKWHPMDEKKVFPQTPYDEMVQTRELQMLKTMVPYIGQNQQIPFILMIQYLEFQHTYELIQRPKSTLSACSLPEGKDKKSSLLNDLKVFCSPEEQEMIDNLLNVMTILDNYELFMNEKEIL